jgi:hypothetical protein
MKVTLEKVKDTLKDEINLLRKHNFVTSRYEVLFQNDIADYLQFLLDEVFTGYVYMTPKQLKKIGRWK